MNGNTHIASLALPPLVKVAQGVLPALTVMVVVSCTVVVSQTVPVEIVTKQLTTYASKC